MATFRKRNGKWQVQVRRNDSHGISKTFTSKNDAQAWAKVQEQLIETDDLPSRQSRVLTLKDLLERYEREVVPYKRTDSSESFMLRVIRRHPMVEKRLALIKTEDFADFRDSRLREVKPGTVLRQLRVLKHALRIARDEWGWPVPYGEIAKLRMPQVLVRHTDRVTQDEIERVLNAAHKQGNDLVAFGIGLAATTGMRRGELLALDWRDINLADRRLIVRMSKNGRPRVVPLSHHALLLLKNRQVESGPVLPMTANCLKLGFLRARRNAKANFRFHDLRHEAISRFFELGLTIPEVQLISGHRTLSQLSRYSHPDVERVAKKLAS